jgi:hypothetical protein
VRCNHRVLCMTVLGMLVKRHESGEGFTSESCDLAMSTMDSAAGCTISRVFMIVAPSFEITTCQKKFHLQLSVCCILGLTF